MSFKSFDCYVVQALDPQSPYGLRDELLGINSSGEIGGRIQCNPEKATLIGAQSFSPGISESEFIELWPLIVLLLVSAFGIKYMRKTIGH